MTTQTTPPALRLLPAPAPDCLCRHLDHDGGPCPKPGCGCQTHRPLGGHVEPSTVPAAWLAEVEALASSLMCEGALQGEKCAGHRGVGGEVDRAAVGRCQAADRVVTRIAELWATRELPVYRANTDGGQR
jgi:hypothetical protein